MTDHPHTLLFDGPLCRAARTLLGLSQLELCGAADCSRKLLNDFENSLIRPKDTKLEAIKAGLEREGAVFVRIDDMLAVGVRPGRSSRRSARGRSFATGPGEPDGTSVTDGEP
ncbi:helix-turn-helix domain-containing protein [Aureimonas jatrophae]|uniref:HTH cro/C1-type domain-containing protein n=1 Tax=Aureimonas jatrophae TaxID=1166073 RepID=A0A1H0M512_9HYPH|nr:helix-turn-helix transcriptional regulator [Aureimonas jatrophae]MBB3952620.1 transcriptional regulator with XRE-family HTH domain [Aureimonas jatrophae]SDO75538.1 hypothetical protein SAMN05192530_11272 [Aureimonas jatrophae]